METDSNSAILRQAGSAADKNGIYFLLDRRNSRCGITDRLKAAVGLYYLARLHGLAFHIIHQAGFDLRDYLMPNRVPWSAERSDLSPFPWRRRSIRYLAPYRDLPMFREDLQYVCRRYIGNNILEKRNVPDWQRIWRELFWDLFTPTENVCRALASDGLPERYTAVVVRFINSLGRTEDADYNEPFPPEIQEKLLDAAMRKVAACAEASSFPAVVYSDSARFLEVAARNGFLTTDVNGIGNVMNKNVGDYVILRTFVNLLQMAGAEQIYSVLRLDGLPENSLYRTQYPRYAAIIGDRPFIRC